MITIHITPDNLEKMRFAYRPLLEIPLSYRVLINPRFQSPYHWWIDETRRTVHDLEFPYLDALVPDQGYIPDFLTPTPTSNRADIEADFEELLATPDDVIRKGILELIEDYGNSEIRQFFLAHPPRSYFVSGGGNAPVLAAYPGALLVANDLRVGRRPVVPRADAGARWRETAV